MSNQPEAPRLADRLTLTDYYEFDATLHCPPAAAELRRLVAEHEEDQRVIAVWRGRTQRAEAQRDALLEALKEYGWHHEGCPQYPTYTHPDRWPACTCGFDDAIKAVEGEGA